MRLTCKCGNSWDYQGHAAIYATCTKCKSSVRIPGRYPTLLAWHMVHSLRVETYGTGRSYVVVPDGETMGGHLETVKKCVTVDDWGVIDDRLHKRLLIPIYAYDRVVVAGLGRRIEPDNIPDPME